MISINPIENFNKKFEVVSLFTIYNRKILLLKRQKNKPQEKTWGPPAGKVDNGENLEQAICRETFEETSIKIETDQITKYKKCYYVRHDDVDFVFYVYAIELNRKPEIILRPAEHSEHSWFTPQEALGIDLVQNEETPITDFFFKNKKIPSLFENK